MNLTICVLEIWEKKSTKVLEEKIPDYKYCDEDGNNQKSTKPRVRRFYSGFPFFPTTAFISAYHDDDGLDNVEEKFHRNKCQKHRKDNSYREIWVAANRRGKEDHQHGKTCYGADCYNDDKEQFYIFGDFHFFAVQTFTKYFHYSIKFSTSNPYFYLGSLPLTLQVGRSMILAVNLVWGFPTVIEWVKLR